MLSVRLINDQATVNNFFYVEEKEYVPNVAVNFYFQLWDPQTKNRVIPGTSGTVTVVFENADGTQLSITATKLFSADDRSLWKAALNASQSNAIVGSNFKVTLDVVGDASDVRVGMAYNVVSKITFDGDC